MADLDFEVYGGKTFKDLCKDVVERSMNKKDQIDIMISDLRSLIKQPNDVQVFIPRIKELLEVGVKNDEQLIKLAAVVQRIASTQIEVSGGEGAGLTEAEKQELLNNRLKDLQAIKKDVDQPVVPNIIK
jgi:hypothetical protein